ncbi:MAG: PEP/pyruvate-binding domain-containing protein [Acidobacteriia bacterium]|nr:PEP/pyruvate-binding domain-containing protein [Terriglobia bacterium]
MDVPRIPDIPRFDRKFFDGKERFTRIGSGKVGGKGAGLLRIHELLLSRLEPDAFPSFSVGIPTLTVVATDMFEAFMERNRLHEVAYSDLPDDRIASAFRKAELPTELLGDLRGLIEKVHQPLAVRSSSLLEDALYRPFAGIYQTKMIPNNQLDADSRFRRLTEAIKFVYASTFSKSAKNYVSMTDRGIEDERMAVLIQEVVGRRHGDRFYPDFSGVVRSYSFYRSGHARPEDGVVNLALGLGKSIVDGGLAWSYCPAYPKAPAPFASAGDLLDQTQAEFWAVNMGKPPAHDPMNETEYLGRAGLADAESDGTLWRVASTYDPASDRLRPGLEGPGPRVLDFSPILVHERVPLNSLIRRLMKDCEEALGEKVEIEFAVTFEEETGAPARFGFLQVRPLVVSREFVEVSEAELTADGVLLASENVMGNGVVEGVRDLVYVRPGRFEPTLTRVVAGEIAAINSRLLEERHPFLLVGFGRWGSSDPSLGIPVDWGQICGARAIVEATLPNMNVDLSQGSHFFHNISSFEVSYFCVRHDRDDRIDWEWLERQPPVSDTGRVRHLRLSEPLAIRVDGRTGRGVIRTRG